LGSTSNNWWSSTEIDTLIKAVDIKVRSEHLRQIESETTQSTKTGLKISVIICTFQRNAVLEKALRAAADQTMLLSDYEVVVVDNNPEGSGITELIDQIRKEEFAAYPDHLRLIHCPVLGLSFARNTGIAEAKSDILLFLDDDAIAKQDILEQYWNAFSSNKDAGLIGGHIILRRPEKISMIWRDGWERYWSQFKTGFQGYTSVEKWWDFPWGANWCARRRVLMQIGGFRSRYGRRGKDFQGGEEIVAASLIQRLGYTVAILPQAEVIHQVDPSRFTLDHLKRTIKAGLFTHYQMQRDLYLPFESNLRTDLKQFGNTSGELIRMLFHPGKPENRADALESYYHLSARMELLMKKIADVLRRVGLLSTFLRPQ
jgi:GT2 family glycosyltransferase